MATVDTKQIIYSMQEVGRIYPPKRQVLKDISLSFYYGAKIGVLGDNGSGKSTLLRIMAGKDSDHTGTITMSKGYSVGILEQDIAQHAKRILRSRTIPRPAPLTTSGKPSAPLSHRKRSRGRSLR